MKLSILYKDSVCTQLQLYTTSLLMLY